MGNYISKSNSSSLGMDTFTVPSIPTFEKILEDVSDIRHNDEFDVNYIDKIFKQCCQLDLDTFIYEKFDTVQYLKCTSNCGTTPQWVFHCRDCMSANSDLETYVYCSQCFIKGEHIEKGHSFYLEYYDGETYCDCGDRLIEESSCKEHQKSKVQSRKKMYESMPVFVRHDLEVFINYLFRLLYTYTKNKTLVSLNKAPVKVIFEWLGGISKVSGLVAYCCMKESSKVSQYYSNKSFIYHIMSVLNNGAVVADLSDLLTQLIQIGDNEFLTLLLQAYLENYEKIFAFRDSTSVQLMILMKQYVMERYSDIVLPFLISPQQYGVNGKCFTITLLQCLTGFMPRLMQYFIGEDETENITLQNDLPTLISLSSEKGFIQYALDKENNGRNLLIQGLFQVSETLHMFRSDSSLDFSSNTFKYVYYTEISVINILFNLMKGTRQHYPERFQQFTDTILNELIDIINHLDHETLFNKSGFDMPRLDKIMHLDIPLLFPLYRCLSLVLMFRKDIMSSTMDRIDSSHIVTMLHGIQINRSIYITYDDVSENSSQFTTDFPIILDMLLYQLIIVAIGPAYFLNIYFNITNALKISNPISSVESQLKILISAIKGIYTLDTLTEEHVAYHFTHWIFSKLGTNFQGYKTSYENLFFLDDFEKFIPLLKKMVKDKANFSDLQPEYLKYFDLYYHYFALTKDAFTLDSFFAVILDKKERVIPELYKIQSLPLVIPELSDLHQIYVENDLSNVMVYILLSDIYNTSEISLDNEESLPLSTVQRILKGQPTQSLAKDVIYFYYLAINTQVEYFNKLPGHINMVNDTIEKFLNGEITELPQDTNIIFNLIQPIKFNGRFTENVLSLILQIPCEGVPLFYEYMEFIKTAIQSTVKPDLFGKLVHYVLSLKVSNLKIQTTKYGKKLKSKSTKNKLKKKNKNEIIIEDEDEDEIEQHEEHEEQDEKDIDVEGEDEIEQKQEQEPNESDESIEKVLEEFEDDTIKVGVNNIIEKDEEKEIEDEPHQHNDNNTNNNNDEEICCICKSKTKETLGIVASITEYGYLSHMTKRLVQQVLDDPSVNQTYKSFLTNYFIGELSTSIEYLPYHHDPFQLYSLYLFNRAFPSRIKSCGHLVHFSCCAELSEDEKFEIYECLHCHQTADAFIPKISKDPLTSVPVDQLTILYKILGETDFSEFSKDANFTVLERQLWKFVAQGVQTIDIISRKTKNSNINDESDKDGYFVIDDKELESELNIMKYLYHAIQKCPVAHHETIPIHDNYVYITDTFTIASYSHYISKGNLEEYIKKGSEIELFKLLMFHFINQKVDPNSRDMQSAFKNLKPSKDLLTKLRSQIFSYLRRSVIMLHLYNDIPGEKLTLDQLDDYNYVASKLGFNLEQSIFELDYQYFLMSYSSFGTTPKLNNIYGVYPPPSNYEFTPDFITLPETFTDLIKQYLFKKCSFCNACPYNLICLACGSNMCTANCKESHQHHIQKCSNFPTNLIISINTPHLKMYQFSKPTKNFKLHYQFYQEHQNSYEDILYAENEYINNRFKINRKNIKIAFKNWITNTP